MRWIILAVPLMLCMSLAAAQSEDEGPYRLYYLTQCYADAMELAPWDVRVLLVDDTVNINIVAQTRADVTRYRAVIYYNVPALARLPDSARLLVPIHELAHVLTAEVRWMAMEADSVTGERVAEQLVSRIERWAVWGTLCP
jgi:hypothetical protein